MDAETVLDILADLLADRVAARLAQREAGEKLLSVSEAAERLGIARSTLYGLIGDGAVHSICIGRRRLVPASAIEALVRRSSR